MVLRTYSTMNMILQLILMLELFALASSQTCPSDGTPTDALGPFYVASAPVSTVVGPQDLLQDPSNRLEVSGNVRSVKDCSRGLSGVTIEIWYAGQEGYRDDEYRGMFVTGECGKYNYTQTFRFLYTGRPLHVHIRASRGNEELLVTQMYFVGQEAGYRPSRTLQAVEITEANDGSRSVVFDIFLDAEGDSENCSVSAVEESSPMTSPINPPSATSPVLVAESPMSTPTRMSGNNESPTAINPEPSTSSPTNSSSGNTICLYFSAGFLVLLLVTLL